eukprot:CAMPEP_0170553802 /NCGR_PEP_ID=MMETSP0211-20121228/11625_1 /TAXON_ID=311385 /ORGANISM="Pseudokeronopsis sp., Strain OXSARD2" /LENGTH=54 /DNA_ID=CAMNT_0010862363 /DNA_START=75 /DNA_END=239 /DNA_ORIENTATION=-
MTHSQFAYDDYYYEESPSAMRGINTPGIKLALQNDIEKSASDRKLGEDSSRRGS